MVPFEGCILCCYRVHCVSLVAICNVYSPVLLPPVYLICSQSHIWSSWLLVLYQWLKIARSKGPTRLGASLPEDGSKAGFRIIMFFLKIYTKSKIRRFSLRFGLFLQYAYPHSKNSPTNTVPPAFLAATVLLAARSLPYRHRENSRFIADNQSGRGLTGTSKHCLWNCSRRWPGCDSGRPSAAAAGRVMIYCGLLTADYRQVFRHWDTWQNIRCTAQRIAGILSRRFKATYCLQFHTLSSPRLGYDLQDTGFHSRR